MGYIIERIENVKNKLAALPAIENKKREVTKQEAISMLKDEIEALQKRGYSLDEIAKKLTEEGIDIKTTTLKNYLTRLRRTHRRGKKKVSLKAEADVVSAVKESTTATFVPRNDSDNI